MPAHWADWEDRRAAEEVLERVLSERLPELARRWCGGHNTPSPEVLAGMVDWFLERSHEFVQVERFGPFRFASIRRSALEAVNMWEPRRAALAAIERRRYPTLDAWLAALHRGDLSEATAPRGPSAYGCLPRPARVRLDESHRRLWKKWPLLCACGQEFLPLTRKTRRCPECRSRGKARRT